MRDDMYYSADDLYFSHVYGNGIYQWTGEYVEDPFSIVKGTVEESVLLTNILTNEIAFMRKAECDQNIRKLYREKLLNPPYRDCILWPVDIVMLSESQAASCAATVDTQYTWDPKNLPSNTGVLFSWETIQNLKTLGNFLNAQEKRNWKNKQIQKIAVRLIATLIKLNETGCLYNEFHLNRIFVDGNEKILFDYSGLTFPSYKDTLSQPEAFFDIKKKHYPPEFGEPALILGKKEKPDLQSQNYSVAALLFYILLNRYCYDGRLLASFKDEGALKHFVKFEHYHKNTIFVFDQEDDSNRPGVFIEEEKFTKLWQDLPEEIRTLFTRALSMRGDDVPKPIGMVSLEEWRDCFEKLGWDKEPE